MVSPISSLLPAARRSASTSRSPSKGWARTRSSGRAPWVPTARSPRNSMESVMPLQTPFLLLGRVAGEVRDHGDELASERAHLAVQDLLDHGDRLGPIGNEARPAQVPGDDPHEPVPHLLLVDDDPLAGGEPVAQLAVHVGQHRVGVVLGTEGDVGPGHTELVVGVQVVGGREEGHHPGEALAPQPQDLLVAPDGPVVAGVPTRPFAHRQFVLDDPGKEARGDALGPLPSHAPASPSLVPGPPAVAVGTWSLSSREAWTVAATSCTRTARTPWTIAHTADASDPSKRSSTGAGGDWAPGPRPAAIVPRNDLRLAPTITGRPVATSTSRCRSSSRLWRRVLPKPMPGSIHTSGTPAVSASSARRNRNSRTSVTTS